MRTMSALWQAYQADTSPSWGYEFKAVIDGQTYTAAEIFKGWTRKGGLTSKNLSLGNCIMQQFDIEVKAKQGVTVAKNAKVEPYVRINGDAGATDWYRMGVYYVDTRAQLPGGRLRFSCLDRLAFADVPYLTDGEPLGDYPMPMDTAMARIYTQLGCSLDARCTISHTMAIEYPNDMTMRQVAGMIASAHGGNFCITDDDALRLVVPGYGTAVAAVTASNASRMVAGSDPVTYDSVALIYSDAGDYFESGATKLQQLDVTNYWATQAMADAVAAVIAGYTYTPYTAEKASLDPAIELGDHITVDGVNCNLWAWEWDSRFYCKVSVPADTETSTSEFGYTGTLTQALGKKVSVGTAYFGATISRTEGLKIEKSDGSGQVVLNSEQMVFKALKDGQLVDRIYLDPVQGTYIFDGKLSAECISSIVVDTPNLYAGKATIAEVTVDQLDTSDKVQKYLAEDMTPDNFQRLYDQFHEFITASVTGTYGATVTSSGEWTDAQTDIYYPNMTVDPDTGELSATGGASLTAAAAFAAGKIYRVKSVTEYYKLTAVNGSTVSYDVYTVSVTQATSVQATNRAGDPLYWTDANHTAASATETAFPVYTYAYTENHKMRFGFREDPGGSGFMIPMLELGVGSGTGDAGKGFMYKGLSGLYLDYYRASDGELRRIILGDDGIVLTPYALEAVDFYNNGFSARYSGETTAFTWTKDGDGKITKLTTEDNVEIPITWHAGAM